MNKIIAIIVVITLAVVGGYFLLKGGYRTPAPTVPKVTAPEAISEGVKPTPTTLVKEVTVVGREYAFSPSTISISAGERVKITFQNNGGTPHNLVIEGLGISTRTIGSGKTDIVEFTAPASGTYSFFCSVPGHRVAGMEGNLRVE